MNDDPEVAPAPGMLPGAEDRPNRPGEGLNPRVRLVTTHPRAKYMKYYDIALRLPFLFLMDLILLHDIGLNFFGSGSQVLVQNGSLPAAIQNHHALSQKEAFFATLPDQSCPSKPDLLKQQDLDSIYEEFYGNPDWRAVPLFAHFLMALTVYFTAFGLLILLNTSQLIVFYTYLASLILVPLSFIINNLVVDELVKEEQGVFGHGPLILANYVCQSVIGFTSSKLLKVHWNNNVNWLVYNIIFHSSLLPSALAVYGVNSHWLRLSVVLCAIPPVCITLLTIGQSLNHLVLVFHLGLRSRQQIITDFGLNTFLELEWGRLHIPSLLRTFWTTRLIQQLVVSLASLLWSSFDENWVFTSNTPSFSQVLDHWTNTAKELLSRGNETVIAVLGMTSIVSKVCHYVGSFFHHFLTASTAGSAETDDERSVASVCAIAFFILALQTGLTSLNPDKRLMRLYQNLCLLITAVFHFIHNMVGPILIGLAASSAVNYRRHLRALLVCLFLTLAPLVLLAFVWHWFTLDTFLLAVTVFSIEVIIKVFVTVTVYCLLLYDARVRQGTWEELDDAVYVVKAAGNSVEFICAVLLFLNGGWILFFESGGIIRAVMMLIHAYCNIWCEAKSGWKAFVKRRSAVGKINLLPDASPGELAAYDDVCSICYQNMEQAKLTKCQHMFHGICLRKWLYVQDTCPLCHAQLVQDKAKNSDVIDNDRVEDDQQDGENSDDDDFDELTIDSEAGESDSDLVYDSMEEYMREARIEPMPSRRIRRLRGRRYSSASDTEPHASHDSSSYSCSSSSEDVDR